MKNKNKNKTKNVLIAIIVGVLLIVIVSANIISYYGKIITTITVITPLYDDFSSDTLDTTKWEIRKDVEGQSFVEEYGIDTVLENFHTQQNIIGDRRVYLVPTINFTVGDSIEYDVDVISREGHYGNFVLVIGEECTGLQPNRCIFGMVGNSNGPQPFDELGITKASIVFYDDRVERNQLSPSGQSYTASIPLQNPNGSYQLYIGAVSGHNGKMHMDFDNFTIWRIE